MFTAFNYYLLSSIYSSYWTVHWKGCRTAPYKINRLCMFIMLCIKNGKKLRSVHQSVSQWYLKQPKSYSDIILEQDCNYTFFHTFSAQQPSLISRQIKRIYKKNVRCSESFTLNTSFSSFFLSTCTLNTTCLNNFWHSGILLWHNIHHYYRNKTANRLLSFAFFIQISKHKKGGKNSIKLINLGTELPFRHD